MKNIFLLIFICVLSFIVNFNSGKAQSRIGKDYALFFAVSDYDEGSGLTDLDQPIKNAENIAEELEGKYGFITEIVKNPSFEDIQTKLSDYEQNYADGLLPADGQLIVFFSGHGIKNHKNGYFLPRDVDTDKVYLKGIAYNIWRPILNDFNCKHILVVVDACFSVTFDPNWESKSGMKDRFRRKNEPSEVERVQKNHSAYKSRIFFTSDSQEDITPGRSDFARQLLKGLEDHYAPNGFMTAEEIFANYVKKASPTPNAGHFGDDDPRSSFLFFLKTRSNLNDAKADRLAWAEASTTHTVQSYRLYLVNFPKGEFFELATEHLKTLEQEEREELAWDYAKLKNTEAAYRSFIENYPNSSYTAIANRNLEEVTRGITAKSIITIKNPTLIQVPSGQFQLGDQYGEEDARPPVNARLRTFYIASNELTFEEYDLFCDATEREKPSDYGWGRGQRPVINVSWFDAIEYCNWLSVQMGMKPVYDITNRKEIKADFTSNGYRLPTEAEWEYVATYTKEGNEARYGNGKSIADSRAINFDGSEKGAYSVTGPNRKKTIEVGSLKGSSNGLGVYDLSGNVREWCWDWYGTKTYRDMDFTNHQGDSYSSSSSRKVLRGGGFDQDALQIQTHTRRSAPPAYKYRNIGFRLAQSIVN